MDRGKRDRFIRALRAIGGKENILDSPAELILYEFDASLERATPEVVALPGTSQQVEAIVRLANCGGVPYVARGAGTGLSGGSIPVAGGLVISMARFNRILEIDLDGRTATVEPGVVNLELNNSLARHGYWFAPDPASWRASTIGGNAAENAGGPHCLKYGVTSNHVLGLEVVLPDGRLVQTGGKCPDVPGYDVTGLLVGSEGTLGIITKLIVRIGSRPQALRTMLAIFETMEAASRTVSAIIASGILPATLEMMDSFIIRAVEDFFHIGYPKDAGAVLIIEVDGLAEGLDRQARRISEICHGLGAREVQTARSEEERQRLWLGRREFLNSLGSISPSHITADGTVPRNRLPDVLTQVVEVGRRYGVSIGNVFHAGDGNLHPIILVDPENLEQKERAFQACHEIMRICIEAGGTISGEHGIGLEKIQAMPLLFGPADLAVMEAIKASFDPAGLCNPGKVFPGSRVKGQGSRAELPGFRVQGSGPSGGAPGSGSGGEAPGRGRLPTADSIKRLEDALGPDSWTTETPILDAYQLDGWRPSVVLSPSSPEEAARALQAAAGAGMIVVPWGSGTKMGLGFTPERPGAVLSTGRLAGVLDHNPENMTVTVLGGTPLAAVQEAVGNAGQMVPLDPPRARAATVGGILAANSSGPRRFLYGGPRDLGLGLRAVLPDGRIIRAGGQTVKNVAGYDLTKLFVGSLGTLGLIAETTLKLRPLPEEERTVVLPCRDLAQAGDLVRRIMGSPDLLPAALELMDAAAAAVASEQVGLSMEPSPVLVLALEGFAEEVAGQASRLEAVATSVPVHDAGLLWRFLADGPPRGVVARAGVPAARMIDFMQAAAGAAARLGVDCPTIASLGAGATRLFPALPGEVVEKASLPMDSRPVPGPAYVAQGAGGPGKGRLSGSPTTPAGSPSQIAGFLKEARSLACQLGGYLVVEEGPGPVKTAAGVWGDPGPAQYAFERIKAVFDPEGVLSPGRFVGRL